MLIRASRIYFKTYLEHTRRADPIQINLHFLQLIPPGSFSCSARRPKIETATFTYPSQNYIPVVKNATICSLTIFTVGYFNTKLGIDMDLSPIPTPDREHECARWTNSLFYKLNPPTASVRYYNPNDGKSLLWGPEGGRDQWGKLDSGDNFRL